MYQTNSNMIMLSTIQVILFFMDVIIGKEDTCLYLYRNCLDGNPICHERVANVQKYCGDYRNVNSFRGCYEENYSDCKRSLEDLISNFTQIRTCSCNSFDFTMDEIGECNQVIQYISNHPCRRNPPLFLTEAKTTSGNPIDLMPISIPRPRQPMKTPVSRIQEAPFNPIEQEMNLRALIKAFQIPNRVISSTTCNQIIDYCQQKPECSRLYLEYSKFCSSENLDTYQAKCRSLKRDVQSFGLAQSCTCDEKDSHQSYSQCLAHQNYFLDNQPLAVLENRDQYSHVAIEAQQNLEEINNQNCLRSSLQCTSSPRCLSYLLRNDKCHGKMREYLSWPDTDSYLPLCSCQGLSDNIRKDCNVAKKLIQPDCTPEASTQRHCVATIRDCANNPECRNAFLEYSQYCLKDTRGQCYEENFGKCFEAKRILLASNSLPQDCLCTVFYSLEVAGKNQYEPLQLNSKQEAICSRFNKALHSPECFESSHGFISYHRKHPSFSMYDFQADQGPTSDESLACNLVESYEFKKHSILRIYNGTDYHGNAGQNFCSKLCKCNGGCQGVPCLEKLIHHPKSFLCQSYQIFQINSNQYICKNNRLWSNRPNLKTKILFVNFNLYELELMTNSTMSLLNNPVSKLSLKESSIENLENEINSIMLAHQKNQINCQFSLKSIQPKLDTSNMYTASFELINNNEHNKLNEDHHEYCHELGRYVIKKLQDDSSYQKRYLPFLSLLSSVELLDTSNLKNQAMASSLIDKSYQNNFAQHQQSYKSTIVIANLMILVLLSIF